MPQLSGQPSTGVVWEPVPEGAADGSPPQDGATPNGLRPPSTQAEAEALLRSFQLPSPLFNHGFQYPTAFQLRTNDLRLGANFRSYFPPSFVIPNSSTSVFAGLTLNAGLTDTTELGLAINRVDSSFPGIQGQFDVTATDGDASARDIGYTVQLQQQLWKNQQSNQAIALAVSAALGSRAATFTDINGGGSVIVVNDNIVPALQIPYTIIPSSKWQFTISPTVAFFPQSSALFLSTAPISNPGSFGTLAGFTTGFSYQLGQRITLWADSFWPLAGNNSIDRVSAKPAKSIVYNAGLRYLVNPRLGLDLYATNAQGSMGPIGLLANPNLNAVGTNLVFLFDATKDSPYPDSFKPTGKTTPLLPAGFGFYGGGVTPVGRFALDIAYGSQGFNGSIVYGVVNDFDLGLYLGYANGSTDESEQGVVGRVRLLDQVQGAPLTATLVGTIAKTNQPFLNYLNNDAKAFKESGLKKTVPLITDLDRLETGQLWLLTASLPLVYQFSPSSINSSSVWIAPIVGLAQRLDGLALAGFNLGGSWAVSRSLNLVAEVGANLSGRGNGFEGSTLADFLPWSVGVRWNPVEVFGQSIEPGRSYPQLYAYLTNRVGQTPWLQMRVRPEGELAVGMGLTLPF